MNIYNHQTISSQLARRYPIGTLTPEEKNQKLENSLNEAKKTASFSSALFFAYLTSDVPILFTVKSKILKKNISGTLMESGKYPFPDPIFKEKITNDMAIENFAEYVDYERSGPELLTPLVALFFIKGEHEDFVYSAIQRGGVDPNHTVGETSLLRVAAALLKIDNVRRLLHLKADPNLTSPLEAIAKPMDRSFHTLQISIAKELLSKGASPLSRFQGSPAIEGEYSLAELAKGIDQENVEPGTVNNSLIALLKKQELIQSTFEENYTTLIAASRFDEKSYLYQAEPALINLIAQYLLQIIRFDAE